MPWDPLKSPVVGALTAPGTGAPNSSDPMYWLRGGAEGAAAAARADQGVRGTQADDKSFIETRGAGDDFFDFQGGKASAARGVFGATGVNSLGPIYGAAQQPWQYLDKGAFDVPGVAGINADYGMATNRGFNRQNPTMDPTQQNQARASQWDLVQQLQAQARGEGPSLAQMQLRSAADQNIAQAMALGASQRGMGGAGMMKGIQNQQAGIAGKLGGDSAMLRLQEQMAAQQMLGGTLQGLRGQDIGFQQADVASRLQGNALNDQLLMNAMNGRAGFATNVGQLRAQGEQAAAQQQADRLRLLIGAEGVAQGAAGSAYNPLSTGLQIAGMAGNMASQFATMPMGGGGLGNGTGYSGPMARPPTGGMPNNYSPWNG